MMNKKTLRRFFHAILRFHKKNDFYIKWCCRENATML